MSDPTNPNPGAPPPNDPPPGGEPPPSPPPPPAGDPPPSGEPPPGHVRGPDGKFVKKPPEPPAWSDIVATIDDDDLKALAGRYDSPKSFAKAAAEFKKAGSNRDGWVKLLGENATDEERAAYRKAMGVPDGPEHYGVSLPEEMLKSDADRERQGRFLGLFHELGLPRGAVERILGVFSSENRAEITRLQDQVRATDDTAKTELRGAWGNDHDRNAAVAVRAILHAGGDEFAKVLREHGIDQRDPYKVAEATQLLAPAQVLRMFSSAGLLMAEHVPEIAMPLQSIKDDLGKIQAEEDERKKAGTFNDPDFQRRRTAAYQAAYSRAA